jgi:nicotinamidase/pyrazinamidase
VTTYDRSTALIVVDVQNDFVDPRGSLAVSGAPETVPTINDAIASALEAGALVVFTQDWHPPDTPHFEKDGGIWPVHCVRDTWGAAFYPDLRVPHEAETVHKGTGGEDGYSGFTVRDPETGVESSTTLETLLRSREITRTVIAGFATDYCVKATAIDSVEKGFETAVLRDAVAAVDLQPGDGESALAAMEEAGVKVS